MDMLSLRQIPTKSLASTREHGNYIVMNLLFYIIFVMLDVH